MTLMSAAGHFIGRCGGIFRLFALEGRDTMFVL